MNLSALDFKLGLRMLRRYPGITAMATVAMAVAIALGMLYFEGLNKVLHPVLPVAGGDRIITIRNFDVAKIEAEATIAPRLRDLAHAGQDHRAPGRGAGVQPEPGDRGPSRRAGERRRDHGQRLHADGHAAAARPDADRARRTTGGAAGRGHRRTPLDDTVRARSGGHRPVRDDRHRDRRPSSASCRNASAFR